MRRKNKKKASTFKLYSYVDGAEIGMPLNEIREKALRLHDQIYISKEFDKKEITNFLVEVYCCSGGN